MSLISVKQLPRLLNSHRWVNCALQQFRERLHVHSEIQLPPSSEKIQVTLAYHITHQGVATKVNLDCLVGLEAESNSLSPTQH